MPSVFKKRLQFFCWGKKGEGGLLEMGEGGLIKNFNLQAGA